jgi:hypothetical protein
VHCAKVVSLFRERCLTGKRDQQIKSLFGKPNEKHTFENLFFLPSCL